jgi:ferrous iron transport protein A
MPRLSELVRGQKASIDRIEGNDGLSQRLMEMGVLEGEGIEVIGFAPLGDPMEITLRGYRLSLRKSEAGRVLVTVCG